MILQSQQVFGPLGIPHGFSLRNPSQPGYGNASLKMGDPVSAAKNRNALLTHIGLDPRHLTLANQVHGTRILRVEPADRGRGALDADDALPSADGLVTAVPECPIGVLVADCCCLLASDFEGRVAGAFHAGWRGTLAGMAAEAVETFHREYSVKAKDLRFWIGPAISGECYETSRETWEEFFQRWEGNCLLDDPPRVDLPNLNREQLVLAGVPREGIEVSELCTYTSPRCFSHRRGDNPLGRMLGCIAVEFDG
jgi:purine-nucleoside/S-methyl-5'-thioadenosine phosphorylase / adenosine deaminase